MMSPMSAEASVVRSYIEWMVSVPWSQAQQGKARSKRAAQHFWMRITYGLEEVKDRILEYLAVQKACP